MSEQAPATYWACEPCHLLHAKCDRSATGKVPCPRCLRRGRADKCHLRPIRPRGPKAQMDATKPVDAQAQADALRQVDATADVTLQQYQDNTLSRLFLSTFTQSQADVVNSMDVGVPSHLPPFGVSHTPIDDAHPSTSSGEMFYESPAYHSIDMRASAATTAMAGNYGVRPAEPSAQSWVDHDIERFDTYPGSFPFDFSTSITSPRPAIHVNTYPYALDANFFDVSSGYNPVAGQVLAATVGIAHARADLDGRTLHRNIMHGSLFDSWGGPSSTGSLAAEANYGIYSQANQSAVFSETFLAEFEDRGSIFGKPRLAEAGESFNSTCNNEEYGWESQHVDGLGSFEPNKAASTSTDAPQNLDFMGHCGQ